jgi:Dockerin type I domain
MDYAGNTDRTDGGSWIGRCRFLFERSSMRFSHRRPTLHRSGREKIARRLMGQKLDERCLMAGDLPLGAAVEDTGEYLLGRIAVTAVFFDSNGQTDTKSQNWDPGEIDRVLGELTEGVNWWSRALDRLNTVHSLDIVIDDTYARQPVSTNFEPIDRSSNDFPLYLAEFYRARGYAENPETTLDDAIFAYNNDQRIAQDADWSFTIFVVDSSDDADDMFPSGAFLQAFAYEGGMFMIVPSERPAQTFAHEMGHLFWAHDEYPGGATYLERRGYYNTQVTNAANNPSSGFVQQPSIMTNGPLLTEAYLDQTSPASTFAAVGWQDSDGDGIFDVLDVPLKFEATAAFDTVTSTASLKGSARAVALPNENSSGLGHDITINRVSHLQYRLEGLGIENPQWVTVQSPDSSVANFDVSVVIESDFETIQWRVVEETTGQATYLTAGTKTIPGIQPTSLAGISYVDTVENGVRDADEIVLPGTTITITHADQTPLFWTHLLASDFPAGPLSNEQTDGLVLTSEKYSFDIVEETDAVGIGTTNGTRFGFAFPSTGSNAWNAAWGRNNRLLVEAQQPVGRIAVQGRSLSDHAAIRVEAFDSQGNRVERVSAQGLSAHENFELVIIDPQAEIASFRVWGINHTRFEIHEISGGVDPSVVTDANGLWKFAGLPEGDYRVKQQAPNMIYQDPPAIQPDGRLMSVATTSEVASTELLRVDSLRHNTTDPYNVDGENGITALDALAVMNEIRRLGGSQLLPPVSGGPWVDVDNNGEVSPIDALMVMNYLRRRGSGSSGEMTRSMGGSGADSRLMQDALISFTDHAVVNKVVDTDRVRGIVQKDSKIVGSEAPQPKIAGESPSKSEIRRIQRDRFASLNQDGSASSSVWSLTDAVFLTYPIVTDFSD